MNDSQELEKSGTRIYHKEKQIMCFKHDIIVVAVVWYGLCCNKPTTSSTAAESFEAGLWDGSSWGREKLKTKINRKIANEWNENELIATLEFEAWNHYNYWPLCTSSVAP